MITSLGTALVDVLFPPACAACRRIGRAPFCLDCGASLRPASVRRVPGLEGVRACFDYEGPAARALHRLKYEGASELGRSLGSLMVELARAAPAYDLVVPVPLSRARLRTRGYNQAWSLARRLPGAKDPRALERVRDTPPQMELDLKARRGNVRGAFRARRDLEGRRILLVDDVVTTGATLEAAAAALGRAGCAQISGIALLSAAPRATPGRNR